LALRAGVAGLVSGPLESRGSDSIAAGQDDPHHIATQRQQHGLAEELHADVRGSQHLRSRELVGGVGIANVMVISVLERRPEIGLCSALGARDGAPIDLPARELGVLEVLLRAHPGALSAERLLEQAWDDPFTKTVQVTVGRLRRELCEPQAIQTIPGVGYRIV
jgi:DNA-binding response OmpR family regulator